MRVFLSLMVLAVSLGPVATTDVALAAPPAPPPIEAYGKLPGIEMVKLSPSGERYALIAETGKDRRIVIATSDNKLLDALNVGDAKVRSIEWAGEDHLLVFTTKTVELGVRFNAAKSELATVIVHDLHSHKTFQVFGSHQKRVADIIRGAYGTTLIDGHYYGYFGGITYRETATGPILLDTYPDLYRVDLDTGEQKLIARGEKDSAGWLVSRTGELIAHLLYKQSEGNWYVMADPQGHTLASGHDDFRDASLHFGKTPDTILVNIPREDGNDLIEEIPLAGGTPQSYDKNANLLFDRANDLWIGTVARTDGREITLFSAANQAKLNGAAKAFPKNIVHIESWSTDFNRIVVRTEGYDDSGTYWLVDIPKRSADPIGSVYPEIQSRNVGPVRMLDWNAADGLPIHGVLTLPPGRDPKGLPVVVLPHGGPELRDYAGFDWWAQAFASRGYAVLQPNFRGSSGYGVAFRNAGLGQWGRKMQTDISDGVAMLAKAGIIDPKRACIVGASYGGYAALAGVTVQQGLYRCAVSVAGVADLSDMLDFERQRTRSSNTATRYWGAFMGVTSSWGSELDPISPAKLASRADAPILLIHGKDDTVVPFDQSETMERALKRAGKPVEFVVMENEDHWLSREDTRITMLKSAVSFVEKYNPPD